MQQYRKNLGKVSLTSEGAWNIKNSYEVLSIVYDEHTEHGFLSKKDVPAGVDLYNKEYWMPFNVSGYADNNVIILSKKTFDGSIESYTLEEAIKSIASVGRRPGAILGFYNANNDRLDIGGRWEIWQFNDVNIYNWENVASWHNIYYNYNKFVGWYKSEEALKKYNPFPEIGCYAFVGNILNEAVIYRCYNKYSWEETIQHACDYVKITINGTVTVGENGNWFNDGVDTNIPASIKGDSGLTPFIRYNTINNRLEYSYDKKVWYECSDDIAAWFRWQATSGDTQANNVGRIQISRNNVTWTNLSGDIINNLHISRYIGADETLPTSGIAEGTIYAKGPTYADGDTSHSNPIYRLWVYAWKGNTLAWQDNGEFTSIAAGIVQDLGLSDTETVSQKAITNNFHKIFDITGMSKKISNINTFESGTYYNNSGPHYNPSISNVKIDISDIDNSLIIEGIDFLPSGGNASTYFFVYAFNSNLEYVSTVSYNLDGDKAEIFKSTLPSNTSILIIDIPTHKADSLYIKNSQGLSQRVEHLERNINTNNTLLDKLNYLVNSESMQGEGELVTLTNGTVNNSSSEYAVRTNSVIVNPGDLIYLNLPLLNKVSSLASDWVLGWHLYDSEGIRIITQSYNKYTLFDNNMPFTIPENVKSIRFDISVLDENNEIDNIPLNVNNFSGFSIFIYTINTHSQLGKCLSSIDIINRNSNEINNIKNIINIYTLPDNYKSHIDSKISILNENIINSSRNNISFGFITDTHWSGNTKNSPAMFQEIKNSSYLDFVVFGGDAINGGEKTKQIDLIKDFNKKFVSLFGNKFYPVLGNHEFNDTYGGYDTISENEIYNLMYSHLDDVKLDTNFYYYQDNTAKKIRTIILDSSSGNIDSAQLNWFYNQLYNIPNGWNVIVITHWMYDIKDEQFFIKEYANNIVNALGALKNKSSFAGLNFENKNVNVICCICGHVHEDYHEYTSFGFPIICTTTDAVTSRKEQPSYTYNDQAFDIFTIDVDNRNIKCTRFGTGTDRQFLY